MMKPKRIQKLNAFDAFNLARKDIPSDEELSAAAAVCERLALYYATNPKGRKFNRLFKVTAALLRNQISICSKTEAVKQIVKNQ